MSVVKRLCQLVMVLLWDGLLLPESRVVLVLEKL